MLNTFRWRYKMKQKINMNIEQREIFYNRILKENISRVNIIAYVIMILELFMLLRNIYHYRFTKPFSITLYISLILACIIIIFMNHYYEYISKKISINQETVLKIFYIFTIYCSVIISIVDQKSYGHVTAYLTVFMMVSMLYTTSKKSYYFIHIPPLVLLIVGILLFQDKVNLISNNIINLFFFFTFCTIGARLIYKNYCTLLIQEISLNQSNQTLTKLSTHYEKLSIIDDLTQLSNRRGLYEHIETHIVKGSTHLTVMLLDIDAFKQYNDSYGHMAGDDALKKVSKKIQDVVVNQHEQFVARFGGEEFVVITTDELDNLLIAETIRKEVENLQIAHNKSPISPYVTLSIGVAEGNVSSIMEFDDLVRNADKALYEVKKFGRNNIYCYNNISY